MSDAAGVQSADSRLGRAAMTLRRGDIRHHGDNSDPVYAVSCAEDGRTWVRDISSGAEGIADPARWRWLPPRDARRLEVNLRRAVALPAPADLAPG